MPQRRPLPPCSLPGTALIQPLAQGDVDGLCGLYCILNAIRLVMAPLRKTKRKEARALFAAGVHSLEQADCLAEAVHSCVGRERWQRLARSMVGDAREILDHPIRLRKPKLAAHTSARELIVCIEDMIASGEAPCVFFRGKYRHYSVICGYTSLSLRLFDSFGHHRMLKRTCSTGRLSTSLHRLHVPSLISISAT